MSARLRSARKRSYALSSAISSALGGRRETGGGQLLRANAGHTQLADRSPQRLRQRGMLRQGPEVAAGGGPLQQEPHQQRRPELLFGGVDAALHQERRAHTEGDWNEPT